VLEVHEYVCASTTGEEEHENHVKRKKRILSPYFYYRYGTKAQFEQARQRYVASLSEVQKQQYDEAVIKFQEDVNSPIKRGKDWAYLTVVKKDGCLTDRHSLF
jgi:TolA-binding protein